MKTTTPLTLLLLAAVAGCGDGLEPAEYSLGRDIVETFATHVDEDPSDIRVRNGAWKYLRNPEIADAIEEYVEEAGIAFPAWTEHDALMPRVPGVIHGFTNGYGSFGIRIQYGGVRPGCAYPMSLDRLEGGGWRIGEPKKDCRGFSSTMPWRLVDGKWVVDPK